MKSGFTLIELVVVLTIISILVLAVLIGLNPLALFAQSRDAKRWSDAASISTALYRYIIQTGKIPDGIDEQERQIGTADTGCGTTCGSTDACLALTDTLKPYLDTFPIDPLQGTAERTLYSVQKTGDNVLRVRACGAEAGTTILVAR